MIRKILLYFALKYQGDYYKIYEAISKKENVEKEKLVNIEKQIKANYLTIIDNNYPACFKNIPNPPFVIFYYGDINLINMNNNIGIIGKRKNTDYGKKMTFKLISELNHSSCIVSGLAKGIDALSHQYALEFNLKTIAVLGSGIDYCYPKENMILYKQIKEKGLIISEYPNQHLPYKKNFLIRNRLIAALVKDLIVIEADLKSGTMNTVSYGLEYGKEIYCVPERANINSGCNYLIKQGAHLLESIKDIF